MDAKRLEELVIRANTMHADGLSDEDYADLKDLARCAAAWAKVERALSVDGGQSVSLVRGFSGIFYSTMRVKSIHDTAIAAVEAAPEVTDANKG